MDPMTRAPLALLALALPLAAAPQHRAAKPNVVFILTDDQGYWDLHSQGNPYLRTPQMDRLRDDSVRFTNFHVSPSCAPSRAGLMTGRYPDATGVWHTISGRSLLNLEETTVAQDFHAAGYRTAIFGKWHLGDNYPYRPQDRGFDEVVVIGGGGDSQTPDYFGNDYTDDTYLHNGRYEKYKGFCTDVWFDNAMRFMRECKRAGKPFFVYLPTNAAHAPFWAPPKYEAMYRGIPRLDSPGFYGMITNIDDNLGRLRKFLQSSGLDRDTILVFASDNGGELAGAKVYNGGMRGYKMSPYDGGHLVPLFFRWPGGGLGGGREVGTLADHIDIRPTLDDLAGVAPVAGPPLHGRSLKPLLSGNPADWPERTLFVDTQARDALTKWRATAVMTQRWRLVTDGKADQFTGAELYDIQSDPNQAHDIAAQHPDVVAKLKAAYEDWWKIASARAKEYSRIPIGDEHANPVRLTAHDWHGRNGVPWNQQMIREGIRANGYWTLQVARTGTYRIELRRWPTEVDLPIDAPYHDAKPNRMGIPGAAIAAVKARLQVADFDQTIPVAAADKAAVFTVPLREGPVTLETWFLDADGKNRGAYYVYIERLAR